jgi:hypothetical protein
VRSVPSRIVDGNRVSEKHPEHNMESHLATAIISAATAAGRNIRVSPTCDPSFNWASWSPLWPGNKKSQDRRSVLAWGNYDLQ